MKNSFGLKKRSSFQLSIYRRQILRLTLFCVQISVTLRKEAVSISHREKKINVPLVQCLQFSGSSRKSCSFQAHRRQFANMPWSCVQFSGSPQIDLKQETIHFLLFEEKPKPVGQNYDSHNSDLIWTPLLLI